MTETLKTKALSAFFWSFLESIGLQSIRFILGIFLARLLIPEEFGLLGMLSVFIAVAQLFLDFGFGAALIQKNNPDETDICSIFYFNLGFGAILTLIFFFSAPFISSFYNEPALTPLMKFLSFVFIINALGQIQYTLLRINIDFRSQMILNSIAAFLSGVLGIVLAWKGYGVWSLAFQQVTNAITRTFLLWSFSKWRPSLLFKLDNLKRLFGFGSKIFLSGIINQAFENIYPLTIGKFFSATDLGLFTRAKSLQNLPTQTISSVIGRITFPLFSKIKDDPLRMKAAVRKALSFLVFLNFPIMAVLIILSKPLVILLLTDKWLPCVPMFRLFCIVGMFYPLHLLNLSILQAMGRSDKFLKLEIIKKLLAFISLVLMFRFGIIAIIYGMIITSLISLYINSYYTRLLIDYSFTQQLKDLLPYLLISTLMGSVISSLSLIDSLSNAYLLLSSQFMFGTILYLLLCRVFKLPALTDILNHSTSWISQYKSHKGGTT